MVKKNYCVDVMVPGAGLNVDSDLFKAAGSPSSYSGCCMKSGDRDLWWRNLSADEAFDMAGRLRKMLRTLNRLNGRALGGQVKILTQDD